MNIEQFNEEVKRKIELLGIISDYEKNKKLFNYMLLLKEKNKKVNLTAITDENEIILKHFIDSLTISKYCTNSNIIDVGTGAGFPRCTIEYI